MGADTQEIYDQVMDEYANQVPPRASFLARAVTIVVLAAVLWGMLLGVAYFAGFTAHLFWIVLLKGWQLVW